MHAARATLVAIAMPCVLLNVTEYLLLHLHGGHAVGMQRNDDEVSAVQRRGTSDNTGGELMQALGKGRQQ